DLPARDGYYIIHVDEVIPPTAKPIAEVRGDVAKLWEAEERQNLAKAAADKIVSGLGSGEALASVNTKIKNTSAAPLGPVTRFGEAVQGQRAVDPARVSPDVLGKLFAAKIGDVIVAPVQSGIVIARLQAVDAPKAEGALATAQEQLSAGIK